MENPAGKLWAPNPLPDIAVSSVQSSGKSKFENYGQIEIDCRSFVLTHMMAQLKHDRQNEKKLKRKKSILAPPHPERLVRSQPALCCMIERGISNFLAYWPFFDPTHGG